MPKFRSKNGLFCKQTSVKKNKKFRAGFLMARNKKINSFVWTSSYGCKWHKLPKYLKIYIKRRKILVKAVPGRKISQNFVNEVKEIAGKNQCHIFILGNNSPTI